MASECGTSRHSGWRNESEKGGGGGEEREKGNDEERSVGERADGCNRATRAVVNDCVGLSFRVLLQFPCLLAPTRPFKLNTV